MNNITQIIQGLTSVVEALSSIEVKGKENLLNLGGCIAVVEDICKSLTEQVQAASSSADSTEMDKHSAPKGKQSPSKEDK